MIFSTSNLYNSLIWEWLHQSWLWNDFRTSLPIHTEITFPKCVDKTISGQLNCMLSSYNLSELTNVTVRCCWIWLVTLRTLAWLLIHNFNLCLFNLFSHFKPIIIIFDRMNSVFILSLDASVLFFLTLKSILASFKNLGLSLKLWSSMMHSIN